MSAYIKIDEFVGKTLTNVKVSDDEYDVWFTFDNGDEYHMFHQQDCCENVYLEDVNGSFESLIGSPIITASERTSGDHGDCSESCTWTFYEMTNHKGTVVMRWVGESNGYYGEGVDIVKVGN